MPVYDLNTQPTRELIPGFHGRFVHTENVTVAFWTVEAGAVLPEHSHIHEQVTSVLAGEFELTVAGESHRLLPGSVATVPGNAIHSGRAVTDCRLVDVFHPARPEYR